MENSSVSGIDILSHIAEIGDVEKLHQLLSQKPLLLHQLPLLSSSDNPLHISSSAGHLDFVREIVNLKPEFATELNPDGFSPMHLAAANGRVEVVREIIRVDPKLCSFEGVDGKTPFHFAVIRGKVDVISEILANCEGCIEDVTVQKETVLHLAVKNCQFRSLRVLLDWIGLFSKEYVLNMKDEHGNTVLHLAIWKKQRQVLELLIINDPARALEMNAINASGMTALDLLLIFPSEAGDIEIHNILTTSGALKAQHLPLQLTTSCDLRSNQTLRNPVQHFKYHKGRDSPSEVRGTLLVIVILVAAATYQVGINPPGGLWQDDDTTRGHIAGTSIIGTKNSVSFILLVASNSIGLFLSLYMIGTLTANFPLQTELKICLFALYFTYNLSLVQMSPESAKVFTIVFTSVLPTFIPVFAIILRKSRVCEFVVGFFVRS